MRIQNNIPAQYGSRQIKIIRNSREKSMKKLASGYRVNSAADDAAVLTISEKMRAQIKGLDQGSTNVNDGISVLQVAEGAMQEITDMMQRMRELTIKSYNGTMTQEDRLACQFEVDSLLEEIGRIAESTEFNTMKVLQGGPGSQKLVKASEVSTTAVKIFTQTKLPPWVTGDNKLLYNNGKVDASNKQDVSGTMIKNEGQPTEEIWGGKATDPTKKWTESLSDNAAAVLDFSALASLNNKEDILERLASLISTGVGFPCATCTGIKEGFYFATGSIKDTQVVDGDASRYEGISLDSLMAKVSESPATTPAELKALAEEVAKDLVNTVLDKTTNSGHFDNIKKLTNTAGSETYSIVAYDFRDKRATDPTSAENDVDRELEIVFSVPVQSMGSDFYETVKNPIPIQAGAFNKKADTISLKMPNVTLAFLNLEKYSVFKDKGYSSLTSDNFLEENYKNLYEKDSKTGNYVLRKGSLDSVGTTYTETKVVDVGTFNHTYHPGTPPTTNAVGEVIPGKPSWMESIFVKTGEKTETFTYTNYTRKGDQSALVYEPSDLTVLDSALDSVVKGRSQLGAYQNRLEHAQKINNNSSENLQAAESKMRDTDIAAEMMKKSKDDILSQASESMLAQANQNQQSILSLLQA